MLLPSSRLRSDDPRLRSRDLDGQRILLPTRAGWRALMNMAVIDGRAVGVGRLLVTYRALAEKLEGLEVALGDDPTPGKPWWVLHVAEIGGALRRIHVEGQTCPCGWSGITGNVRDYQLYAGTPDPWAALQAHWDTASLPCPACDAPLPRPAAWIGTSRTAPPE